MHANSEICDLIRFMATLIQANSADYPLSGLKCIHKCYFVDHNKHTSSQICD